MIQEYITKGINEKDEFFQIWTNFISVRGSRYQGSVNAVRFGLSTTIKSFVKSMIEDFYALGKSPNANMIMHWLSVIETAPEYWAQQMIDNLSISMSGRKNHNVALDYLVERLVDTVSNSCNRSSCSEKTALRVSTNSSFLHDIRSNFEQHFAPNTGIYPFPLFYLFFTPFTYCPLPDSYLTSLTIFSIIHIPLSLHSFY